MLMGPPFLLHFETYALNELILDLLPNQMIRRFVVVDTRVDGKAESYKIDDTKRGAGDGAMMCKPCKKV